MDISKQNSHVSFTTSNSPTKVKLPSLRLKKIVSSLPSKDAQNTKSNSKAVVKASLVKGKTFVRKSSMIGLKSFASQ